VIDTPNPTLNAGHDHLQPRLALDQRKLPQITAVQHQDIERAENRPVSAEQQLVEVRPAGVVEADDFAVEHRGFTPDCVREFDVEVWPVLKRVAVPRHQGALVPIDVRRRAKPIERNPSSFSSKSHSSWSDGSGIRTSGIGLNCTLPACQMNGAIGNVATGIHRPDWCDRRCPAACGSSTA